MKEWEFGKKRVLSVNLNQGMTRCGEIRKDVGKSDCVWTLGQVAKADRDWVIGPALWGSSTWDTCTCAGKDLKE